MEKKQLQGILANKESVTRHMCLLIIWVLSCNDNDKYKWKHCQRQNELQFLKTIVEE